MVEDYCYSPGALSACHWNQTRQRSQPAKQSIYKRQQPKLGKIKFAKKNTTVDESNFSKTPVAGE
jgi:hypothetical protein